MSGLAVAPAATAIIVVSIVPVASASAVVTAATAAAIRSNRRRGILRSGTHFGCGASLLHPRSSLGAHGRLIRWFLGARNIEGAARCFLPRRQRRLEIPLLLPLLLLKIPQLLLLLLLKVALLLLQCLLLLLQQLSLLAL